MKGAQTLAVLWNFPRPAPAEEYEQLYEMSSALSVWAELPQEWLGAPDLNAFVELVAELIEKSRQAAKSRAKLLNTFAEPALGGRCRNLPCAVERGRWPADGARFGTGQDL